MKVTWRTIRPYVVSAAIALAVGGLSALLTRGGMRAFESVAKPPLSPPPAVFPIVWSVLYILMGVGAARVYLSSEPTRRDALFAYALQLFVNFFWPILFFQLEMRLFAFLWLLLLLALVVGMTLLFSRSARWAAWIQLPYLAWLLVAGYLNLGVYLLNR